MTCLAWGSVDTASVGAASAIVCEMNDSDWWIQLMEKVEESDVSSCTLRLESLAVSLARCARCPEWTGVNSEP